MCACVLSGFSCVPIQYNLWIRCYVNCELYFGTAIDGKCDRFAGSE